MLERLSEWGITRIYGYLSDGINALAGACHEASDKIEFIQRSQEELAAFAALHSCQARSPAYGGYY